MSRRARSQAPNAPSANASGSSARGLLPAREDPEARQGVAFDLSFGILGYEAHEHPVEDAGAEDVAGAGSADEPGADTPCQVPDPVAPALDSFPELLPVFLAAVRVNLLTATLEQGKDPLCGVPRSSPGHPRRHVRSSPCLG